MANLTCLTNNISPPTLLKYKIVLVGDQAVGKSSIINRFIYDIFDLQDHRPTIGIDFISHSIFLQEKTIRLQLWDTAGQERFRSLIPNYIRDCSVAIIVYDVTNRTSFQSVHGWIQDIKNQRGQDTILAIVGNKVDLIDRVVTQQQGKQVALQQKALFLEVSAKTGGNVQEVFKQIAMLLPECNDGSGEKSTSIKQIERNTYDVEENASIKIKSTETDKKEKKKKCC